MNAMRNWLKALVIVALVGVAYWPSLRGPFLWDDDAYLTQNRLVTQTGQLAHIWFSTEPTDYYPVTFTAFRWQWLCWGANPTGYRVINILLHAMNALLVWRIASSLEIRGAWLAGLLFALHPVNVATVAWIAELKNILSFSFAALTVLAWLRFDETRCLGWYAAALALFVLALLSKSAVAPLPLVLLGLTWWRRGRWNLRASLPLFGISLVFGIVTVWFQHHRLLEDTAVRHAGFLTRFATAGMAVWFYLGKALLPVKLNLIYPNAPVAYWPVAALVLCLAACWKWRPVFVAFAGYIAMLLPMLGFFDQGFYSYSLVSDHWQYLALPLIIVLVVSALPGSNSRWVVGMMAAIALGALTLSRSSLYANAETLWRDTLAKNPKAWVAHFNLGLALNRRGDSADAEREYRAALQLHPDYVEAQNNLGKVLAGNGRLDEAATHLTAALKINPRVAVTYNNLGTIYAREGRYTEAITCFKDALRINPVYIDACSNLARATEKLNASPQG
jgi:protein O-mannosyl-transferase